jgi:hypothetical protein
MKNIPDIKKRKRISGTELLLTALIVVVVTLLFIALVN